MKKLNMLADARTLHTRTGHTLPGKRGKSGEAPERGGCAGTLARISSKAATPRSATAAKVARQPAHWPSRVPPGTPRMLASVMPEKVSAIARPAMPGGASRAARTADAPMKLAWLSAVRRRAASRL
ncbi:hypothetical protein GCM10011289_19630 [Paludibacterium paludis]|uniref:Uncharacterized protein n=1 Tax=Paludibacterium paludis TaxID=1225769 RepID=A0A918P3C0_9NEIS|nr:hypothetical protein GCM10011289_19630 [Paludibacterium paludis]